MGDSEPAPPSEEEAKPRLFADVVILGCLLMLLHCWNSAIKMKLEGGSEQRDHPETSMLLVMPRAQFLKPLYCRQAPPTTCSIVDNGLPLYNRQTHQHHVPLWTLDCLSHRGGKLQLESSSWKKQDEAPRSWVRSKRTVSVFYGLGDAPGPVFEATLQQGGSTNIMSRN
jgi:hypothetical protein